MTRDQREALEAAFAANSKRAEALFHDHAAGQLQRRPAANAWSAVECIAHLTLTAAATLPLMDRAIAEAGGLPAGRSRMDWVGRLLHWVLQPGRFSSKTAAPFVPRQVAEPEAALADFLRSQSRIIDLLRRTEGQDLSRAKMASAFNPRVKYNVYAAFQILEVHERRHLAQAERATTGAQ